MDKKSDNQVTDFNAPDVVAQYDTYPLIHKALGRTEMLKFIGDVAGKSVLDLGCGTGHLSGELQKFGANCIGVDVSERFIELARNRYPEATFQIANGAEVPFVKSNSIDVAIMSMVILGISTRKEFEGVFAECARVLKHAGELVFSTIHPLNMHRFKDGFRETELPPDWSYFESGSKWKISVMLTDYSWMRFTDAHWSLEDISRALSRAGLFISEIQEPKLDLQNEHFDKLKDELVVPYYIFFRARKRA